MPQKVVYWSIYVTDAVVTCILSLDLNEQLMAMVQNMHKHMSQFKIELIIPFNSELIIISLARI